MKRHEEGKTRVVPIIVRSCDWQAAPFGKLQALPRDGKAITVWHDRDEAWLDVIQGVRKVVEIFAQNAHLPNRHSELRV